MNSNLSNLSTNDIIVSNDTSSTNSIIGSEKGKKGIKNKHLNVIENRRYRSNSM